MSQQPHNQSQVPSAPYPPINFRPPQKSSLSSSPQYSTNHRAIEAANTNSNRNLSPVTASNIRSLPSDSESESHVVARQQFLEQSKPGRTGISHAPMVKLFPSHGGILACINTASSYQSSENSVFGEESFRGRKLGPVLLDLRRLKLVSNSEDTDEIFAIRTIGLSRGNPQLGNSVTSTCLDVPVQSYFAGEESRPHFSAASGLTTGMLAIHTFSEENTVDELPYSSTVEYYHTSRHHRQASAVAWRTNHTNNVAIGLLGSGATGPQQGSVPRRGGSNIRGGGGDREFCCFVWDIEAQQSGTKRNAVPVSKLSHNTPVASLAWILDGQTLAIGTQARNVQLYDMRSTGTNTPPLSALAHNFGVHGIEVDPHKPYMMATFCRSIGEPVKLWDIRRMDSVVSEIKVSHAGRSSQSSAISEASNHGRVEAVKWSIAEPGVISVAMRDSVQDFDTSSSSRPVLLRASYSQHGMGIRDLALYSGSRKLKNQNSGQCKDFSSPLFDALYSRRMVVALEDRTVKDLSKNAGQAPIAISRRDGRLVHALGPKVWVGSTTKGTSAMEGLEISHEEDISATMMRRARCLRVSRYSMNTSSNIKTLAEDIESLVQTKITLSPMKRSVLLSRLSLLRLWSWIERVEALSAEPDESDGDWQWPVKGLVDAGIQPLLNEVSARDEVRFSDIFSCNTYHSTARRLALTSCGWGGKFELEIVLSECEALGEYERSAALATWHGDLGAAVRALQRAAVVVRDQSKQERNIEYSLVSTQYAETLDLIAMCIAGYGGSSRSAVWRNACSTLLQREDLCASDEETTRTVYLRALCQFLLNVGRESSFEHVLNNEYLAHCDRIGFACRFLDKEKLQSFLTDCLENSQQSGNVEGIVITGLSKEGIKILQAYVDRTADVQTAALVVSRVVFPSDWNERKICMEWVEAYRNLLNTWQMWQSRAMFDVDRAEMLRRIKTKGLDSGATRRLQTRRQGTRPPDPDLLVSVPAALDARCNYCSSPFGLRRHEGNANQWLSKMKPVLSCCPQCRKPLPRCSICLLSLGLLNPYMELTRERSRPSARGGNPLHSSDGLSALPLAEWFTWCMNCKHGGHAQCLVGWFAKHDTCPVSGCECHCEFDGIQKLSRPALKKQLQAGLLGD